MECFYLIHWIITIIVREVGIFSMLWMGGNIVSYLRVWSLGLDKWSLHFSLSNY